MHRGYIRVGILLTVAWIVTFLLVVLYQYVTRHTDCSHYNNVAINGYCQKFFWHWVYVGNSNYQNVNEYTGNGPNLFFFGVIPPIAGWALTAAVRWVRKGF